MNSLSSGAVLLSLCSSCFTLAARRKAQKDSSLWAAGLLEDGKLQKCPLALLCLGSLSLEFTLHPQGYLFNLAAVWLQDEPKVRSKSFAIGPDWYRWLSVGGIWRNDLSTTYLNTSVNDWMASVKLVGKPCRWQLGKAIQNGQIYPNELLELLVSQKSFHTEWKKRHLLRLIHTLVAWNASH